MSASTRFASAVTLMLLTLTPAGVSAQTKPELVLQTGHTSGLSAASFSPDGSKLVTGSEDNTAIVWDARTGRKLLTLYGTTGTVTTVLFSSDGTRVLAEHRTWGIGGKATVTVWDAATGRKLLTLEGPTEQPLLSPRFSPDGTKVYTATPGDYDKDFKRRPSVVTTWDVVTGQKLATISIDWCLTFALSPDGQRIIAHDAYGLNPPGSKKERAAVVWELKTGRKLLTLGGHAQELFFFVYSRDGSKVATDDLSSAAVIVHDAATGRQLLTVGRDGDRHRGPQFSPDGSKLYTGAVDGRAVAVWDVKTGQKVATLKVGTSAFYLSPDGERLATPGPTGSIQMWDARTGDKLHTFGGRTTGVYSACFSPDGRRVAVGSDLNPCLLWDDSAGPGPTVFGGEGDLGVRVVAFSPRGEKLAAQMLNGTVVLWDSGVGQKLLTLRDDTKGSLRGVGFSPDGARLATGGWLCFRNRVWNTRTGQVLASLDGDSVNRAGEAVAVAFSPDGSRVVLAGTVTGGSQVVDATTGRILLTLAGHKGPDVGTVGYSRDGSRIVTGGDDKAAIVWDAGTGRKLLTLTGHGGWVYSASFSPDGAWVLTASGDGTAQLWDTRTGQAGLSLKGHTGSVYTAAFSADGSRIVTGSADGTARLWDAKTGAEIVRLVVMAGGKDWLVSTPDGLFDGSAGGRNLVGYKANGQVVPVDRFFKDFYRPGLFAAVMKGEKPKPEVDFAAQAPPKVRITSPKAGEVENPVAEIAVEADDAGGGAQPPWLKHNGVRVASAGQPTKDGKVVRRTFTVTLVEGTNTFEAVSACTDGSWESEPARVELKYSRPLDKPRLFVLAVGVSKYADDALALRFAAKDAKAVHDLFDRRGKQLYKSVEPTLLTDDKATKENIRAAFKDVAAKAKPQDVVLAFVAGHGTLVGQRYYFLPAEFKRDPGKPLEEAVRKAGIPDDELADLVGSVPALKRVLVLDTCNSGGAIGLFAMRGRDVNGLRGVTERMNRSTGVFVLAAAPADASAQEPAELGHGVLTYALLAGFRAVDAGPLRDDRGAEPGPGGVADVLGVFTYATGQVPRLMKKYYGREQDVQMGNYGTSFPLLPLRD